MKRLFVVVLLLLDEDIIIAGGQPLEMGSVKEIFALFWAYWRESTVALLLHLSKFNHCVPLQFLRYENLAVFPSLNALQ